MSADASVWFMINSLEVLTILALDVGDVRIGLALSDELALTAQPFLTLENRGRSTLLKISEIIVAHKVQRLVIGLPLELDGGEGKQAAKTRAFADKLLRYLSGRPACGGVDVEFVDERLTSREAERLLRGSTLKDRDRKEALDKISAALILEAYLLGGRMK
jgi:putative Holliday junction resolvase